MTRPLISIIVPNYNHASFLKQRLDSVFNQTIQDFEVILLDDFSSDNSVEILSSYAKNPKVSHFVINKQNSGSPFKQWNRGIDLAKGKYIWIAESDDYSEPNFLECMTNFLSSDESIGVAYCQSIVIDETGKELSHNLEYTSDFHPNVWKDDFVMEGNEFINTYLSVKAVIPNTSAVVFRKDLVGSDSFDDTMLNMRICGDWLFWLKVCQNTILQFCNKPLNYFRYHENASRHHDSFLKKKTRIIEELQGRLYLYTRDGKKHSKALHRLYAKWFKLFKATDIFKKEFYTAKMPFTSKLGFAIRFVFSKIENKRTPNKGFIGSEKYWIDRYKKGGDSGAGSYDKFAIFKGAVVNEFVTDNNINSVLELGCGDGNQLEYFNFPSYIGFDVSKRIIEQCRMKFKDDKTKNFFM